MCDWVSGPSFDDAPLCSIWLVLGFKLGMAFEKFISAGCHILEMPI